MRRERGMTIIELMIGLALLAFLLMLGLPALTTLLQNFQIRTASEAMISGLQTTRNEALRRNTSVRFQLVTTLDDQCALSAAGPSWLISRNDPSTLCDLAETADFLEPNVLAQPQILMKRSAGEGTANVIVAATSGGGAADAVVFNGLGRLLAGSADTINITNPVGGVCVHVDGTNGTMRCMRVQISTGGKIKLCDPKVTDTADTRYCQ